ncbi:MAG: hypothetical protein Kow0068_07210 [Marinilabiliales bacterium]
MKTKIVYLLVILLGLYSCNQNTQQSMQLIDSKFKVKEINISEDKLAESLQKSEALKKEETQNSSQGLEVLFLPEIVKTINSIAQVEFTQNHLIFYDNNNNIVEDVEFTIISESDSEVIINIKGIDYTIEKTTSGTWSLKTEYADFVLIK